MELRDLFQLDNPRVSTTQQQLEQLHSHQRKTDTTLDAHIAFLHSLGACRALVQCACALDALRALFSVALRVTIATRSSAQGNCSTKSLAGR